MDTSIFQNITQRIDSYGQDVIDLQKNLVSIQALSPENGGVGEMAKAKYVKTILADLDISDIQEFHAPDSRVPGGVRPNILARIPGKNNSRTVWIMAHLDVVPAGDLKLWSGDPFELDVQGDQLVGRGVEDNHQGLVSALLAVKSIKEEGIEPETNIGLAIVADEESGSQYGLHYLLKNHSEQFSNSDLIIVPDAGDPEGRYIEVAEKSILWVRFKTEGKSCHASTPEQGINAYRAAARLLVRLETLADIYAASDPMFDPPTSTFEPTKKEANVPNINTIPGEDISYLDCRILPRYPVEEVEKAIRTVVSQIEEETGVSIEVSYAQRAIAAPPTSVTSPVVEALHRAIKTVKGIDAETIGIGGGTVAGLFRAAGFPTAVWSTIVDTAHQSNEYALISNTLDDAKVFAHVFLE